MAVAAAMWGIAALAATAMLGLLIERSAVGSRLTYLCCLIISLAILVIASGALLAGGTSKEELVLPLGVPSIGARFAIDGLAAFFLIVVNLGGAAAALFGAGFGQHETAPGRVLPFFPAFIASMNLVVLAGDAFTFLFSWELMSLTSWALVMAHHRVGDNRYAGYVYILMAGFGTLVLLLAFGLLAGTSGVYAFADMRGMAHPDWVPGLVLVLTLLGAGSKAGVVPLHVWLPLAHPAAPSHVSAILSGVMTKVAVYGLVRIVFDLLGAPQWWWGMLVLVIGGITAVMGVLYALMQHDLKRLLAYHTVENVGIIFIGLGLALAFEANTMGWAAALALTAALLHVFNHSVFKSLLFFGAGAVLSATGERDMEHLGGLIHRMPQTAFVFLIGCIAISALPPLNGFVSEWLTFQAILMSPDLPQWGLKLAVPAVGALLALSAALAATCFVKAFGVTFLGRPRSPAAARAHETDRWSLAAMFALAALCIIAGTLPGFFIDALAPAVTLGVGAHMPTQSDLPWLSIVPISESRSSYNGLLVFFFIATSAGLASLVIHRLATRTLRRAPPWDCGFPDPNPATQYTASSFAQPIRRVFGSLAFRAREVVTMPPPGDPHPARLALTMHDLIWDTFYAPVRRGVEMAADRLNYLQFLTIRRYLSLVFIALVALLLLVALWP